MINYRILARITTVVHRRLYLCPIEEVFVGEWELELNLKGFREQGELREANGKTR